jgi:hypothetical protein
MNNGETRKTPLDEFLNPKSMLTPGLAGALTMLITNALSSQFGLKPNYTGLVVSFTFGLIIIRAASRVRFFERCVYYGLNSLVIFSVAMGANQGGVTAANAIDSPLRRVPAETKSVREPFFINWLDGTAEHRKQLLANVQNIDNAQASKALDRLHIQPHPNESPRQALEGVAAKTRTAGDVAAVAAAAGLPHMFGD